jgi:ribosome maturation factor RimP
VRRFPAPWRWFFARSWLRCIRPFGPADRPARYFPNDPAAPTMTVNASVSHVVETALGGLGYELVDLEFGQGRSRLLRVFIDKPEGIGLADCERVSRHLTQLFAVESIDYDRLEVSSPGLDRPLRKVADFERFAGEQARVTMRAPVSGRRNFTGAIRAADELAFELDVDGQPVRLEFANLDRARLVPKL